MPGFAYCESPFTRGEPHQSGGLSCSFSLLLLANIRQFSSLMQIAVTGLLPFVDG